ncbi:MAG: histone H1 protein [Thiohalomonadaceae bacterium]
MSDIQSKLAAGVRAVREDQNNPQAAASPEKPAQPSKPKATPAPTKASNTKPASDEAPSRPLLGRRVWPD